MERVCLCQCVCARVLCPILSARTPIYQDLFLSPLSHAAAAFFQSQNISALTVTGPPSDTGTHTKIGPEGEHGYHSSSKLPEQPHTRSFTLYCFLNLLIKDGQYLLYSHNPVCLQWLEGVIIYLRLTSPNNNTST